jgi:hypothetical protein
MTLLLKEAMFRSAVRNESVTSGVWSRQVILETARGSSSDSSFASSSAQPLQNNGQTPEPRECPKASSLPLGAQVNRLIGPSPDAAVEAIFPLPSLPLTSAPSTDSTLSLPSSVPEADPSHGNSPLSDPAAVCRVEARTRNSAMVLNVGARSDRPQGSRSLGGNESSSSLHSRVVKYNATEKPVRLKYGQSYDEYADVLERFMWYFSKRTCRERTGLDADSPSRESPRHNNLTHLLPLVLRGAVPIVVLGDIISKGKDPPTVTVPEVS